MLTEEQLRERRLGVSASDIAAVAGLNPWATPWSVWAAKTLPDYESEQTEAMEMGDLFEEPIATLYARRNSGVELERSGTLHHPKHHWAMATPDRFVTVAGKRDRLLEVKWAGLAMAREWGKEEDGVPEQYIAQGQWQLFVTELAVVDFAAVVAGSFRTYRVERNESIISFLFEKASGFMEMIRSGQMPPIDGSPAAKQWLTKRFPEARAPMREPTEHEIALAKAYEAARVSEAKAKAEKKRLGNMLRMACGDACGLHGAGVKVSHSNPDGSVVNWQAVATEAGATPALIAKHSTPMGRRLYVRLKKEEV